MAYNRGFTWGAWPRVLLSSPPAMPYLYYNAVSQEERIKRICEEIDNIVGREGSYLTLQAFEVFLDQLQASQEQQTDALMDYTDSNIKQTRDELERKIAEVTIGKVLVTDPATGFPVDISIALSNSYNDLRYHAMTWDEWETWNNEKSWDIYEMDTAPYTIRQLDLFSRILLAHNESPI